MTPLQCRRAAKLKNDNIQAYFLLSQLQYKIGESGEALKQVRECLKLDQEHKGCHDFYTKLKKYQKLIESIAEQMGGQRLDNDDDDDDEEII